MEVFDTSLSSGGYRGVRSSSDEPPFFPSGQLTFPLTAVLVVDLVGKRYRIR